MDRRNFLRSMLGVAAVTALPSEIWPFKKIFVPAAIPISRIDILDLRHWGNSKIQAVELETFAREIPDLIYRNTPFYNLLKKRGAVDVGSVDLTGIPMLPVQPEIAAFSGLSRAVYPGRLPPALRYLNASYKPDSVLHAPATPENIMEFINELENDLPKHKS